MIPHQANIRIINSVMQHSGLRPESLITNLDRYGNTASASIPLALTEALEADRIKTGELVLLAGFGAGMTWGSVLMRWEAPRERSTEGGQAPRRAGGPGHRRVGRPRAGAGGRTGRTGAAGWPSTTAARPTRPGP